MKKLMAMVLAATVMVSACQTVKTVEPPKKPNPSWPDAIQVYEGEWDAKTIDSDLFIGMEYTEFQSFRMWQNDVLRYVRDLKGMVCYHQPEDPKCLPKEE